MTAADDSHRSGHDPIGRGAGWADLLDMITAIRQAEQSTTDRLGRFGRTGRPLDPRPERDQRPSAVRDGNYVVDPDAVAAAMVDRLMAGRTVDVRERE